MVIIDGSKGEGGGQVLRTSLSMSMLTGRAFTLKNIRAGRSKPGLRKQHLSCVLAAAEICLAEVRGAEMNSTELIFSPREIQAGNYHFDIGSAGSAGLLLQCILPALLGTSSEVILKGGTHNPLAPNGDFLSKTFFLILKDLGFLLDFECRQKGFFPAGGGEYFLRTKPIQKNLKPLNLHDKLSEKKVSYEIVHTQNDQRVANKIKTSLLSQGIGEVELNFSSAQNRGLVLLAKIKEQEKTMILSEFGIKRFNAEELCQKLFKQVNHYLEAGFFIDEFLADQLMLPMLFTGGSFSSAELSSHSKTNIETIEHFIGKVFEVEGREVKYFKSQKATPGATCY